MKFWSNILNLLTSVDCTTWSKLDSGLHFSGQWGSRSFHPIQSGFTSQDLLVRLLQQRIKNL